MRCWCVALLGLSIGCGGTTAEEASDAAIDSGATDTAVDTSATDTGATDARDGGADGGSPDVGFDAGPDAALDVPLTGCITDKSAGTHVFKCAGVTYDVTIPAACTTKACGLVLDVHGATMTGRMEDANTQMRALGDKYGYVVIQPTAPGSAPTTSWTPGLDDDKVHAVLVEAIAVLGVDANRVHMTGFSQGGMMTSRFLCRFAELFASMAPAAGTGCSFLGLDAPSREVPVLYLHGTKDVLVAFTEGVKQRDAAVAAWKMSGPTTLSGDANHSCKQWTSAKGTVFEFVQHDYKAPPVTLQGHCYPGSTDKGSEPGQLFSFACTPPSAFVWGEEVMKFFVAHPRT